MANVCTICPHPDREKIDRAVLAGDSFRAIAGRYGVSRMSVYRHRESGHLLRALVKIEEKHARIALEHSLWLCGRLRTLAEGERNPRAFLKAADTMDRCVRTLGVLNQEISAAPVQVLFQNLNVRDESELRSALELQRGSSSAGVDDLLQESLEALRFCLRERPEMRESVLRMIGAEQSGAVVLEAENGHANGHGSPNGNGG